MSDQERDGVSLQETPSRAGGRPPYKPTAEQRATVRAMRRQDPPAPRGAIAAAIGVSQNTLRKHFAVELDDGPPPVEQQLDLAGAHKPAAAPSPAAEPGRPEFEPTYRQREEVRLFKADDWSDERIASYLGISRPTLLKHFAPELEYGVTQVRARVLRNLQLASDKGNVAASERLLKLPGMLAPSERLPTPDRTDEEPLGKKERANRAAQTASEGTSWEAIMKH